MNRILVALRGLFLAGLLIGVVASEQGRFNPDVTWMSAAPRSALPSLATSPTAQPSTVTPSSVLAARTSAPPALGVDSRRSLPVARGTSLVPASRPVLVGLVTWYRAAGLVAAAGPALRRALGPGWRGTEVTVKADGSSVRVQLTDWCACGPRNGQPTLLDLSDDAFARLAPLPVGVVTVTVRPVAPLIPPATDR